MLAGLMLAETFHLQRAASELHSEKQTTTIYNCVLPLSLVYTKALEYNIDVALNVYCTVCQCVCWSTFLVMHDCTYVPMHINVK